MNTPKSPATSRRAFLKGAAAAGLAALAGGAAAAPPPPAPFGQTLRGVNLGAWLVLEKWMVPSVFAGTAAPDEYTFCRDLGAEGARRLKRHHDTWITEADFAWIAARGLNTVRLPVGYWVLDGDAPFRAAPDTLDRAFVQARRHGLRVLLDLHGAPGSQNGWDHSGRAGALEWPTGAGNVARTLDAVEALARHCARYDNLWGFELLNEPRWDVPLATLKRYYQDGYERVRKHVRPEVAVVLHDGFRSDQWADFMQEPGYHNVVLDTHLYQCFTDKEDQEDIYAHITQTITGQKSQIALMQKGLPTMVGEWSAALSEQSLAGLTGFARDQATRAYADAEFVTYGASRGWLFWSYKMETPGAWNFRDCVARGIVPTQYAG